MLSKLYAWYGRKTVWGVVLFIIALAVIGLIFSINHNGAEEAQTIVPTVEVATVAELQNGQSLALLGTVRAVSEANIQSESAGRVTSVPVKLGQQIAAGQVIATLENASQRAAVLQAEGAYEAALAAASSGNLSVTQAETSLTSANNAALSSIQSAYTTVNNGFFTEIDDFYRNPNSPLTSPYISDDNRSFLSQERVAFQDILPDWQAEIANLDNRDELAPELSQAIKIVTRTRDLVDAFLQAVQNRNFENLNGVPRATIISNLNVLRGALEAELTSLKSAQTALTNAENALAQAQIGGTETELSAANAQVKQALGTLRAAEANLAKTIMQSPIAGTVNELDVRVGDFLPSFAKVAKVANNQALEVTVFVGERDLAKINVGDTVMIDNQYTGTVTNIGAGVDSDTQKTEVKIATETTELTNGDTVTVTLEKTENATSTDEIVLPITAIKFSADAGSVFTVVDGKLVEHPISIGAVRGGYVTVSEGVTPDMQIVLDARGRTAGSQVEASQ